MTNGSERKRPRVVIVGGGFGGVAAAKALKRAPVDVTLIDRNNHQVFQPLLYEAATAALEASDVARRIQVFSSWVWSFFTSARGARLIAQPVEEERARSEHVAQPPHPPMVQAPSAELPSHA